MKKKLIIGGIIAVLVLIMALVIYFIIYRSGDELSDIYYTAYVFEKNEDSLLVAEGMGGKDLYDGDIERLEGEAYLLNITNKTKINDENGESTFFSNINLYDEIRFLPEELLLESYPAVTDAVVIEKTGLVFEIEGYEEPVETLSCHESNDIRMGVIQSLENNWAELELEIPERPSLGATEWFTPYHVQFLGNDALMIAFEDGHSEKVSVVGFDCFDGEVEGSFRVLDTESVYDFALDEELWTQLRARFGDFRYSPTNYSSISVFVDGEKIEIEDWTQVDANLFIKEVTPDPKS